MHDFCRAELASWTLLSLQHTTEYAAKSSVCMTFLSLHDTVCTQARQHRQNVGNASNLAASCQELTYLPATRFELLVYSNLLPLLPV